MKIGFFDSGIGGLTVLREALKELPNEDYIYYADSLHAPYGTKTREEARRYIFEGIGFLAGQGVKAVVIACNTATIIAVDDLREMYRFPIIGMEPAVKPAVERNTSDKRRVLALVTPLALKQERFLDLLARVDRENMVDVLPTPELVEFAEQFVFDEAIIIPYFASKLSGYDLAQYGTVVLGCTHFPLFKGVLRKVLPDNTDIIDGSIGTVKRLKSILDEKGLSSGSLVKGETVFYESGKPITDGKKISRLMGLMKACID